MLTVDIAINGKPLGKIRVSHITNLSGNSDYARYRVEFPRMGLRYTTQVDSHKRADGAFALARDALQAVLDRLEGDL